MDKEKPKPQNKSLEAMLFKHRELKAKLIEALESNHFFITISCQKKDRPDDPHDLRHYWQQEFYPPAAAIATLRHLLRDATATLMPGAEIDDKPGGMY